MDGLCIFLLSKFCVQRDNSVMNIEGRKTQELFSYLLLNRDRPHPRESLAALLWCDIPIAQAKGYLRKALWQLQTALDAQDAPASKQILLVESDWIQLNPEANYWLDVTVFERAFELVQGMPGRKLQPSTAQTLRCAVELYRGDLLEGCYHEWCLYERERFQQIYLIILDKLMDYYEAHEEYETGLSYGMQILRYDQAREHTHRQLMRLQYLTGNRTGALRQYERCAATLEKELGVQPAAKTTTLYEQIRNDQPVIRPIIPNMNQTAPGDTPALSKVKAPALRANAASVVEVADSLTETIKQIKQLQMELNHTQRQIQQKIAVVEMLLHDQRPSPNSSPPA